MHGFAVSDVEVADRPLPAIPVDEAIQWRIAEPLALKEMLRFEGTRTHAGPPALEACASKRELAS